MNNSWIGNYAYSRTRLNPDSVAIVDLDRNTPIATWTGVRIFSQTFCVTAMASRKGTA